MYELILSVMVSFAGPVATIDGHNVGVVTQRYEVSVQGFTSESACSGYAGYTELEKSLTTTFGANTKVVPEATPRCQRQWQTTAAN
jgi:hypothetical protein